MNKKIIPNEEKTNGGGSSSSSTPILDTGGGSTDEIDALLMDFENDPELAEAVKMFSELSTEEMIETIMEMKEMLKDDPEALRELDEVMEELAQMDEEEIRQNLQEIMEEEAVAQSMLEMMALLQDADEGTFDRILEEKDVILNNIIQSGMMSEEEIELFQSDPVAWENELRHIWEELKQEADIAMDSSVLSNDEL